ncbi:MAG: hypothetical protein HC808_13395 [Candidatus Competibacteraceae bacterium]|nr:hypothetical protein [Candidatus Competibacteraceae bacterium]
MVKHEEKPAVTGQEQQPLWRYIPHRQFARPRTSAREEVRKGLLGLWAQLWNKHQPHETQSTHTDLRHLSHSLRDRIAPVPDWTVLRSALDEALSSWLDDSPSAARLQIVIGTPYSGTHEALNHWAAAHNLFLLDPPNTEDLLAGNNTWFDHLPQDVATPLVLPSLEQCYLRHTHGLLLIRQFLQWLVHRPGRCVLGCSSWAWIYLSKAVGINTLFPAPLILEALDGERLQAWFSQLAEDSEMQPIVFRQADNGHFVIPPGKPDDPETAPAEQGDHRELSTFLTDVAAHSRGNPGVAWAIWRYSLSRLPDQDMAEHAGHDTETVWVKPWQQIRLPTPPSPCNHSELFVLQAVLLHDGLTTQALTLSLPSAAFEIQCALTRLLQLDVLEMVQQHWRVSPLAYPAVREMLASRSFWWTKIINRVCSTITTQWLRPNRLPTGDFHEHRLAFAPARPLSAQSFSLRLR